jgi:23S rRNA (guanosine2251-2'-O)-methyltransferase
VKNGFGETKNNQFIVGRNPVLEAISEGLPIDKVLIQIGVTGEFEKELRKKCREANIHLAAVPKEKLNQYFRGNHQGVLAFTSLVAYYNIEDILPQVFENQDRDPLFVVLDGVTDVRNFGAIARSCEVMGADAIIVSRKGAALINEEAVKTSAGAVLRIPICREPGLHNAVEYLQDSGVTVFTTSLEADKQITTCDFKQPLAIVMGAEGKGVNPDLLRRIKNQFIIPQLGKTESLNVSVATGIILYEIQRQRTFSKNI